MAAPKVRLRGPIRFRKGRPSLAWLRKNRKRLFGVIVRKPHRKSTLSSRVLKLAASQVGYKESPAGSNCTKYGEWFCVQNEPWCSIFVSWVLSHCGRAFKYSYVPYVVRDARARRNGLRTVPFGRVAAELKAGHPVLACYDWPGESPGVADHIGFVEKVLSGSEFQAIEGNTSVSNQSNGGEVMRRTRPAAQVLAFVVVE